MTDTPEAALAVALADSGLMRRYSDYAAHVPTMQDTTDFHALCQEWAAALLAVLPRGWMLARQEENAADQLAEAVRGLFGQLHPMCAIEDEPTDHMVVSRKAVLAIIERKP